MVETTYRDGSKVSETFFTTEDRAALTMGQKVGEHMAMSHARGGVVSTTARMLGPDEICPCGSGMKVARCKRKH